MLDRSQLWGNGNQTDWDLVCIKYKPAIFAIENLPGMKFVDVKNDVAFHKIFGNANKTITLISFLNAVLFADGENRVVSVTVENPYLFPPVPQGKTSILDVKATDQEGRKFIVELQIADKDGFDKRVAQIATISGKTEEEVEAMIAQRGA